MGPGEARPAAPTTSDQLAEAIREAAAADGHTVLSYIDPDGFPQLLVPADVRPGGPGQLCVRLSDPQHSLRGMVEVEPRVGLLHRARSGTGYHFTGRARVVERQGGSGGSAETLVVDVQRLEITDRSLAGGEARRASAAAAGSAVGAAAGAATGSAVGAAVVLDVTGLSIHYGMTRAVHELALSVGRGEIFGLLGPNGAGKTSTLSAIEGLLKPRAGAVRVDGTDVLRHPRQARAKMGVALQATSFQASLTIRQILRLYAGLYGVRMTAAEITGTIASIGLAAEADKPFKQLSGGQQQRLALQIAVIHKPVLLLLDEPTAGLDPQARRQLWARIEGLRHDGGSILLTTHSMEEAQAVCDRVAIMDHGQIRTAGSPAELITRHRDDPAVRAVAHGSVTLDDVFVGLTGSEIRD